MIRKYGPIGTTPAAPTPSSIALIESPPCSWLRQISDMPEVRMRLTTKPGTSAQVIGCLRIAWAKATALPSVCSEVSSPSTISISGISDAG